MSLQRPMNISYVTTYNALDIHNWSGLGHYIARSLEDQKATLNYIGNLYAHPGLALKLKSRLYAKMGQAIEYEREPSIARRLSKQAKRSIKENTNIVFSPGTIPIAFLKTKQPKVFYTDATFAGMVNFYPGFSKFSKEIIRHGNYIEQAALESSAIAIYSSDWAAKTAIDNYKINPGKLRVVPFGANVDHSYNADEIKSIVANRPQKECSLLFSGVDWERKGGAFAIKVAQKLNELGLATKLHLLGLDKIPGDETLPACVINHGFISKSTPEGKEKINRLLMNSHFLLLPTMADASPIALCEANSFGIPCVTSDVGGIPTIIKVDINGMSFSLAASEDDYANYIYSVFINYELYKELAYSSFNEYASRLNWKVAGSTIMDILQQLK